MKTMKNMLDTNYESNRQGPNEPPKIKTDNKDDAILNQQDDNSYEEPVTENSPKKSESGKSQDTNKNFEYTDDGEFENGSHLTDTNPNDEFL